MPSYNISSRAGSAEWNRMTGGHLQDLAALIAEDRARVISAAFFAALDLPGKPRSAAKAIYQVVLAGSKKVHAYEFVGKHDRLPLSQDDASFQDGKWVSSQAKRTAQKRSASNGNGSGNGRSKKRNVEIDDDDLESEITDETNPAMRLLEQWADDSEKNRLEGNQNDETHDSDAGIIDLDDESDSESVVVQQRDVFRRRLTRSSSQGLTPQPGSQLQIQIQKQRQISTPSNSRGKQLGRLRVSKSTSVRPVDFHSPTPGPSESGFSSYSEERRSTSSSASSNCGSISSSTTITPRSSSKGPESIRLDREINGNSEALNHLEIFSEMSEVVVDYEEDVAVVIKNEVVDEMNLMELDSIREDVEMNF